MDEFRAWCEESATAPPPYDDPDAMRALPVRDRIDAVGPTGLVPTNEQEASDLDALAHLFGDRGSDQLWVVDTVSVAKA